LIKVRVSRVGTSQKSLPSLKERGQGLISNHSLPFVKGELERDFSQGQSKLSEVIRNNSFSLEGQRLELVLSVANGMKVITNEE
jgi:hypothetical protein